LFHRLLKPWFVYQPLQLVRRAIAALGAPPRGYAPLRTSWGVPVIADRTRMIGRSIWTTGVHDIALSEALARLISPGDTVVDAGAHIGYMTVLASVAAGPSGRVLSFEPQPELFAVLQQNVAAVRQQLNGAQVDAHQAALGDQAGTAELRIPAGFALNDGIASIGPARASGGAALAVRVLSLDGVLQGASVAVLKLDVEGFEAQVLRGARCALRERRIRHIVFEDHAIAGSEVARILGNAGYRLFSLGWSMRGPEIQPVEKGSLATPYEAPNYIATLCPDEVLEQFRGRGWLVLTRSYPAVAMTRKRRCD
jgi:FkbM family methyltransferase